MWGDRTSEAPVEVVTALAPWLVRLGRLPLCRPTGVVFQSCLARTVLAPERFRGGFAPSALRTGGRWPPAGDSPVRIRERAKPTSRTTTNAPGAVAPDASVC